MLDVVKNGIDHALDVRIAVSFTRCSGLGLLVDALRNLESRGGRARLLTSTYMAVTQPAALQTLAELSGVETRVQDGRLPFHAKFWWFSGSGVGECWAGSSNLTKGGLATNLEWNFGASDPNMLRSTAAQFETLWERSDARPLSTALIEEYTARYRAAATSHVVPGQAAARSHVNQTPRPNAAQREALDKLERLRSNGERRAAVIAATGVGKTYLAAFDVARSGAKRVLYVSHRIEHLLQAERTFRSVLGPDASLGVVGGSRDEWKANVVFATVASLGNRPGLQSAPHDYLVIDEFHHVEAPSYEVLRPIRERAFLLGLTATPERQDGHDVLEWCDWNVAYEVRLPEAIDRGWLLPFHYFGIADDTIDFLNIPWRTLTQAQLEATLSIDERVTHILRHARERGFDGAKRATVGFCAGRNHATYMASEFQRRGENAVAVLGDLAATEREEIYDQLADPAHPLEWVFASDVLNEGVDIPALNSLLFLRPTESATLFLQQLGRGLRRCPDTEVLTVLDFVGHHRSAWERLAALDAPGSAGRREELVPGQFVRPPRACEIVLERRTKEILEKVERFTTRKARCADAYSQLRSALGRPVRPVDLWNRTHVPDLAEFRAAYGSWLQCQEANDDQPVWANDLATSHPARQLLKAAESNWQAPRVWPYALLWGLCKRPNAPPEGYEDFFQRWPQWMVEYAPLADGNAWRTVRRKLGGLLDGDRLRTDAVDPLGAMLLPEIEGRLLYTLAGDHQDRHGGVLRTPDELDLFAAYKRPELVRHFGQHYDPSKHNMGVLWFEEHGVIVTKLDTSGAKKEHQYRNRFLSPRRFLWTSQNRMRPDNQAGRRLLEHEERGTTLHLLVQPHSHTPAIYLGHASVAQHRGAAPMTVELELASPAPDPVLQELRVELT